MVKYLTKITFAILALSQQLVFAEALSDPTMPPLVLNAEGDAALQAPPAPVLQSVTLGSFTKFAMISGETVMLGKKYRDYILVQLKMDEAKLKAKDGTTLVLKMDYQVEKTPLSMDDKHHVDHDQNRK